jgi:hypothetical protein
VNAICDRVDVAGDFAESHIALTRRQNTLIPSGFRLLAFIRINV